ncbi:MAG: pyruvate kinase, partial [Parvularculaceae bacterium]|nr:pyruvate kinase [Parvularculaceae bacterium]
MRKRQCKIVATVGPASSSPSMLHLLHQAGVDIFRLNFSHGEHEKTARVMEAIREISAKADTPIAVFADLQGPKIRTGVLKDDGLDLKYGATYRLMLAKETNEADVIPIPHEEIFSVLEKGDVLKLDDGKLQLTVLERKKDVVTAR